MHYILVAKPDDHTFMMEWIDAYDEIDHCSFEEGAIGDIKKVRLEKVFNIRELCLLLLGRIRT
jgi:hypothetical protein